MPPFLTKPCGQVSECRPSEGIQAAMTFNSKPPLHQSPMCLKEIMAPSKLKQLASVTFINFGSASPCQGKCLCVLPDSRCLELISFWVSFQANAGTLWGCGLLFPSQGGGGSNYVGVSSLEGTPFGGNKGEQTNTTHFGASPCERSPIILAGTVRGLDFQPPSLCHGHLEYMLQPRNPKNNMKYPK